MKKVILFCGLALFLTVNQFAQNFNINMQEEITLSTSGLALDEHIVFTLESVGQVWANSLKTNNYTTAIAEGDGNFSDDTLHKGLKNEKN
ncbi:MAG: hypothetical protein Q8S01_12550 [Ignavibacteria bacterium]|nr:hypothetical protein [Ignavibacteria bacterium]